MLPYWSSRARQPGGTTQVESSLVDEERPAPLTGEQAGPVADLRLDQPDVRAEVGEPRALVCGQRSDRRHRVVQLRRGALDAGERADRDDVDGIVGRAVAVGADVLGDEVGDETLDVDRARRHGDRELVGLTRVAHVRVPAHVHGGAGRAARDPPSSRPRPRRTPPRGPQL